jgi:hypothetical protein
MTESGSGQRDDQGRPTPPGSDDPDSGDDYTPSASWETSRGSSWENTTPYESPFARPETSGSESSYGSTAAPYQSVAGYESTPYGQDPGDQTGSSSSAGSARSAAEPAAEDGPWPTYPDQPGYGPSQPGYGQPPSYQQPTSYGSAGDPYPQPGSGPQGPYGSQVGYGEQAPYGQPAQEQYGQPPSYPAQSGYGVNPYQQPVYAGYMVPNHPQATTALILGIVGLALCPFVGIAGFMMGGRVRREIDAAPTQWGGRGLATGGWVLGIISIVYSALVVLYIVFAIVVAIASS